MLKKADATIIELGHKVQLNIDTGDTIAIKTPGGEGFGSPERE